MKSTKPKIIKAVSILLALLSVIGATVPAQALNPVVSQGGSEPVIVEEDISLRGTYEKHFIMSDGSSMAVAYNEPVHYEEDGQWFEIDNTLVETKGGGRIANVKGLENVSFSQEPSQELVVIEKDGYTISWGLRFSTAPNTGLSASGRGLKGVETRELDPKVTARVEEPDCTGFEGTDQLMLAPNAAQLTYEDAAGEGVDVEYTVLPGRVKEAIILESPQDIVSYIMDITAEGLTASINEDGEVVFSNGTEVIFTIWAPYMYDSADELSEEIELDLADNGNGSYTVTLTPDAEWLNDEARVYPITIDPDVSASTDQTNGIDNSVEQGSGVITHTLDRLYAGKRNGKKRRFYQKFKTMPTIPSGATINSATQTFYVTSGTSTGNSLKAYRVDADWNSKTITWANKPAASSTIQSNIGHNGLTRYNIDMKSTVKGWYSGSTTGRNRNYGIMVQYQNETINDFNTVYSADFATAAKRPQLTIGYNGSSPTPTPNPPEPDPPSSGPSTLLSYNKEYYIKNKNSGQYLTVSGLNVQQGKYKGSSAQRWKMVSTGNGECNIIPISNQSYALSVFDSSANNDANIFISKSKTATGSKFKIYFNTDLMSHRILSKTTGFNKAVVVKGASLQTDANVIQYDYNRSANDEWLFIPVKTQVYLGTRYAKNMLNKTYATYPDMEDDSTNFVSQCLQAQGVPYTGKWNIYKKSYGSPNNLIRRNANKYWLFDLLSYSEVSLPDYLASSFLCPWFNPVAFSAFWGYRGERTYTKKYHNVQDYYDEFFKNCPFTKGDAITLIVNLDIEFETWDFPYAYATETMYIVDYCTYNNKRDFLVTYVDHHGNNVMKPLREIAPYISSCLQFYRFSRFEGKEEVAEPYADASETIVNDFSLLSSSPAALSERIDEFVSRVSGVQVPTEDGGYEFIKSIDFLNQADQEFINWLKENPQEGVPLELNGSGLPLRIGDWFINANSEYTNLVDIKREREEIFAQNPNPIPALTLEEKAEIETWINSHTELERFKNEIDLEAGEIFRKYSNGKAFNALTTDLSENMQNMIDMLELLDKQTINYEEFDTVYRYFLRRGCLISELYPEFEVEISEVIQACFDFYSYVYIPNGTE